MESDAIINFFSDIVINNPGKTLPLIFFTGLIVIYSTFVFFFYRYLAKKNIIDLNLKQYNKFQNNKAVKIFGFIFYIVEYVVIMPVLTMFWFSILAFFLLVLSKTITVPGIMIIAASLVTSVRITAYISEKLSQDLAKMLPFTLLALAIMGDSFFSLTTLITRLADIPTVIYDLPYYLLFIIIVEFALRLIEIVKELIIFGDNIDEKETETEN